MRGLLLYLLLVSNLVSLHASVADTKDSSIPEFLLTFCEEKQEGNLITQICPGTWAAQRLWGHLNQLRLLEKHTTEPLPERSLITKIEEALYADPNELERRAREIFADYMYLPRLLQLKRFDQIEYSCFNHVFLNEHTEQGLDDSSVEQFFYFCMLDDILQILTVNWVYDAMRSPRVKATALAPDNYAAELAELNSDLLPNLPTVDVQVFIVDEALYSFAMIKLDLLLAKKIYAKAGVQIRVVGILDVAVPQTWLTIRTSEHDLDALSDNQALKDFEHMDLYQRLEVVGRRLPEATGARLKEVISLADSDQAPKPISIILLRAGIFTYVVYDQATDAFLLEEMEVTGQSYASYAYDDRLPEELAGVITLFSVDTRLLRYDPKTLAHELGHKLMNVSHEGLGYPPIFASEKGGATNLMLYGFGVSIPDGEAGGWQKSRLHASPYLYTERDGTRTYNKPYEENGKYRDPIYQTADRDLFRPIEIK